MNPLLGVFLHGIGGFASASFYVPIKFEKKWRWEVAWIAMGIVAWLLTPMIVATITMPSWPQAIAQTDIHILLLTALFGGMWGFGNVAYGLTMRYLGLGLGVAVALGTCAIFGTLIPPIVSGTFLDIFTTTGGLIVMTGVVIGVLGIIINGLAGVMKERECARVDSLPEFNLKKGLAVAIFCGLFSAGFSFSLSIGSPIAEVAKAIAVDTGALAPDSADFFKNDAVLVVTLWGGFISNLLICGYMLVKNKSAVDIVSAGARLGIANFILCAMAGVCWYGQFFFYGMGTTQLGKEYDFSSWSLHMSFIIIFAALWALALREWKGTSALTKTVLWLGILVLIASTFVIGLGNSV